MFSIFSQSFKFVLYFLGTAFVVFMTLGISITVTQDLSDRPLREIIAYLLDMENLKKIFHDPRTNGAVEHLSQEMEKSLDNIRTKAEEIQKNASDSSEE